jgi:RND family efflux transporter MFP subunit
MSMRSILPRLGLGITLALAGCGGQSEPEPPVSATPRPVKTVLVVDPEGPALRSFPGRVDAADRAAVSFRVGGKIVEIPVREGDQVVAGELLARLDPTEYETVVRDRRASYEVAKANYERGQKLVQEGNISRMDFDRLEGSLRTSEASLALAEQDLADTRLLAPFAGSVARRLVESFEEVQPKEPVIALRNISALELKADVPENLILRLRRHDPAATDTERNRRVPVYATFAGAPGRSFPVTFKEVATEADAETQTFEVTYAMDAPAGLNVLPGMTATLTADLSGITDEDGVFYLPAGAVVADAGLQPRVWVVDEEAMTVHPRPVAVGRMQGASIAVTDGIEAGDRVVVAGVPYLVEGMQVTLMPQTEQAEPRPGEQQRAPCRH